MRSRVICIGIFVVLAAAVAPAQDRDGFALHFDGVDDHVEIGDPVNVTGPLTLEAWIDFYNATDDGGRIFSNRSGPIGFELDIYDGYLRFGYGGTVRATINLSAMHGSWFHVALTWAGPVEQTLVIYLDGDAVYNSGSSVEMSDTTANLIIGRSALGWSPFHGAIDEPRIFAAVVAPEDIRTWMHRRIAPDHPDFDDLLAAWSFEEGEGQTVACVGSLAPACDGQLGSSPDADSADPTWIGSGMVGARTTSWGALKAGFR